MAVIGEKVCFGAACFRRVRCFCFWLSRLYGQVRAPLGDRCSDPLRFRSPASFRPDRSNHHVLRLSKPTASFLMFEPNVGQTDDRVKFVARGVGYGLFLTNDGAVLSLLGGNSPAQSTASV